MVDKCERLTISKLRVPTSHIMTLKEHMKGKNLSHDGFKVT